MLTAAEQEILAAASPQARAEANLIVRVLKDAQSLAWFFKAFWPVIEPTRPLVWNWHLDLICDAIQRQVEGDPEYRRLLIMMPPGQMKSVVASVMRPAWVWLRYPERRSLYLSSNDDLPRRDSRRTRDIIESPFYQAHLPILAKYGGKSVWTLKDDQNEKDNFENDHTGFRQCVSLYGKFTGKRGDDVAMDDVLDAGEVVKWSPEQIAARVELANTIIANQLQSRVNDPKTATWMLIMQGLNGGDPSQVAIRDGDWKVICLPMEYDPTHPYLHPADPRTVPGQLLNEGFNDRAEVERLKRKMKPVHYAWQYQQFGKEAEGGELAEHIDAVRTYAEDPRVRAERCAVVDISVDPTGKGKSTSDDAGIQVWGRDGGDGVLLDVEPRRPMGLEDCEDVIVAKTQKWPMYRHIYIEDTALGPALVERLRKRGIRGVIACPTGNRSKGARVDMGSGPALRSRTVVVPSEDHVPAVREWKHEHSVFVDGRSKRDAHVDATSQMWIQWSRIDADPVWLPTATEVLRAVAVRPPRWRIPTPGGTTLGWLDLPVMHPGETYVMGLVPSLCLGAGAPAVAAVVSESGDVVVTMTVHSGGEDALADAILSLATAIASRTLPGTSRDPTLRVRCADPPRNVGLSQRIARALGGQGRFVQFVGEPGEPGKMPSRELNVWADTAASPERAAILAPLGVAVEGGRSTVYDPAWVDALGAVVVDHETGRLRSGRGTPDPRMIPPGGEMDVRVLALGLAEGLRQSRSPKGLSLVNGGGGVSKPRNDFERYTTPSGGGGSAMVGHVGIVAGMFRR